MNTSSTQTKVAMTRPVLVDYALDPDAYGPCSVCQAATSGTVAIVLSPWTVTVALCEHCWALHVQAEVRKGYDGR